MKHCMLSSNCTLHITVCSPSKIIFHYKYQPKVTSQSICKEDACLGDILIHLSYQDRMQQKKVQKLPTCVFHKSIIEFFNQQIHRSHKADTAVFNTCVIPLFSIAFCTLPVRFPLQCQQIRTECCQCLNCVSNPWINMPKQNVGNIKINLNNSNNCTKRES